MAHNWTDADIALIRQAYKDRTRLLDVANKIGVSKNAVISKADKLGLTRSYGCQAIHGQQWVTDLYKEVAQKAAQTKRERKAK